MKPGGSQSSGRSRRSSIRSVSSRTGQTAATCRDDARHVLEQAGYSVKNVYRVEPDLLLYVDRFDRAKSALIEAREKDGEWLCRVVSTWDGWPVQ